MRWPIKKNFHQANWDEPAIYEIGEPGERGFAPFDLDEGIESETGDIASLIPDVMKRSSAPELPEVAQPKVMKHFTRLSQMTACEDTAIMFPEGTCTNKHNPKVHERLARRPEYLEVHPRQPEETMQGMLEIMYKFQEYLKAISGLDAVCLQPGAGNSGVFLETRILRKYQEDHGFGLDKKDEILTTCFSHPCNPSMPTMSGYKVVTLYPGEMGYADIDVFKAAITERTAGLILSCPEDTGIFNFDIKKITDAVHEAGGICVMDSANANGSFALTRAKECGFDMVHWNLHKSFSSIHGGAGPAAGPIAVRADLEKYLAVPRIEFDGKMYHLNYDCPDTVGKIRSFYGNVGVIMRAFCWVTSLGSEGLKMVSTTAVLNNNYLKARFEKDIPKIKMGFPQNPNRMQEIRWSLEDVVKETGVQKILIMSRLADYGIGTIFESHPPYLVPEPITPEPTETYSKAEIDEFCDVMQQVIKECYEDPMIVMTSPHNTSGAWPSVKDIIMNLSPCWKLWKKAELRRKISMLEEESQTREATDN